MKMNENQQEILNLMNIEYNQVCRSCLTQDDDLKSMYATLEDLDDNILLSEMFMECTSILINDEDHLPKQFCDNCIYQINQFYQFKKHSQHVDESLRYYDEQKKLINNSDDSNDNDNDNNADNDNANNDATKLEETNIDHELDVKEEITTTTASPTITDDNAEIKNTKRKFKCTTCAKMFLTSSHLHTHQLIHTNEKPYVCTVCNKGFNSKPNLKRHNMIHTGERPYKCTICSKSFIQQVTLNDHKRVHTNETPYICDICVKSFKQAGELRRHLKKYHRDGSVAAVTRGDGRVIERHKREQQREKAMATTKTYLCCNCGKSFTSNTLLEIHMRIHTGEKPYRCEQCDKSFSQISTLKTHQLIHTAIKDYQCQYCNKLFRHRIALKQHVLIHMGIKKYTCTYCNKHFTQSSQLNYHVRTHTGEKPYQCYICLKSFALKGNLTVHERIHTGVTPYICPICLKGFYDSSSLKKHQKFKHNANNNDAPAVS